MTYRIATKIPLTNLGRRKGQKHSDYILWGESNKWPILKLKKGNSFMALDYYDYGKTLSIKNMCRYRANKAGKTNWQFSIREHKGTIRVWRTK